MLRASWQQARGCGHSFRFGRHVLAVARCDTVEFFYRKAPDDV